MKNKKTVKILKSIVNFYNTWYGIFSIIIGLLIIMNIKNTALIILVLALAIIDGLSWYKNLFKNFGTKKELFGTFKENNSLVVLGGIGSGKSTLANFLLTSFTPPHLRYYNIKNIGYKAFTNEHLLLRKRLEDGAGVLVDEAGAQADAYHYEKSDSITRKRIDCLNKFFRQWYGDKAHLIYVDQCQGNMNVSLYRNTYYVIQAKGVDKKPSGIVPYFIAKFILHFINKKRANGTKVNNPFTNVSIEFMEFVKLGDYADHYSVTIQDKDHKRLVGSIYTFFGSLDTYVFKDFNPAKVDKHPYVWGQSKIKDKKIMVNNFDLKELEKKFKSTFLKY